MSKAQELLLADARESLLRIVRSLKGLSDHRAAFAAWLLGASFPELAEEALGQAAVDRPVNQKSYRDVATLGYVAAAKHRAFPYTAVLQERLSWLSGRELSMAGNPAGFSTDAIALLGFALGAHAVADGPLPAKVQTWVSGFAATSFSNARVTEYEKFLVQASLRLVNLPSTYPVDRTDRTADVRVALRARNLLPPVHDGEADNDAVLALRLVLERSTELEPLVAALRLAALEDVRKSARARFAPSPILGSWEEASMGRAVKTFISYAWEKDLAHSEKTLSLAHELRSWGIDSMIDQYVPGTPKEGWPTWMLQQVREADFVLVVCTETYCRRFERYEEPGRGTGAKWEGAVITQSIYESDTDNQKFIPVVFRPNDLPYIPLMLKSATRYDLSDMEQYEKLYRYLTNQPAVVVPPLGTPVVLPPRDVKPFRKGS